MREYNKIFKVVMMRFNVIKKYWHTLTIPFMFFTIWLWSFPMYGPLIIVTGEHSNAIFLLFLLSHALGLFFYGFFIDYFYKLDNANVNLEIKIILIFSFLISFFTIIFPYLSPNLIKPVIVIIGLLSGPLVVFYLYYLSVTNVDGSRARVLGLIFFLAGIAFMVFLLLPFGNWMFTLNGLFLLAPLLLIDKDLKRKKTISGLIFTKTKRIYWISLVLLVIMFYVGSGIMYNLLYTDIIFANKSSLDLGFLFYPVVVLPAGFLADKKGRKYLINIGLSFSGLGFLLLFLFDILNSLSLILLQSSFAVMDLFVLLTLIDWTDYFANRKFIGIGLFLNVIVIFLSSLPFLENSVLNFIPVKYWPVAGLTAVMLIIPLLNLIKETGKNNSSIDLEKWCTAYSISPREKEIISLLLAGKDTKTITDLLFISYNTLKTHLRNIYRKTATSSQTELILFIWKATKNS